LKPAWRPKLWHLSALVLVSAVAMALARELPKAGGSAAFGLVFLAVAAASYLGSVYVGARLAGLVSDRLIERGRSRGGLPGQALVALGILAYFAITLGVAGVGLLVIVVGLAIVGRTDG